jgi:hypothetical protein
MEPMPDYTTIQESTRHLLFAEYNDHARQTEEKYLGIFVAFIAGMIAVVAANHPSQGFQLAVWQWLALGGVGTISAALMFNYRRWKRRYHQHIAALMRSFGIPDHLSPFRPTGGDNVMLGFVVFCVVFSTLVAVVLIRGS